jgi:hypothetical protein
MILIATVLSGLALLAASMALVLVIQEKKRNQKRSAATADYVAVEASAALREAMEALKRFEEACEKRFHDLEVGLIPDHEEAKKAVQSLNDFNRGISSIMGFDPYEALRKENQLIKTEGDE